MIALLSALLKLAAAVAGYMRDKGLLEAGAAIAVATNLRASLDALDKARKARADAVADFDRRDGVPDNDDPNLRD